MNKEVVVNQNLTPITFHFNSPLENDTDDKNQKKRKRKNRPNLMWYPSFEDIKNLNK